MEENAELTLNLCDAGQTGIITKVEDCAPHMSQRMAEMGLIEGNRVRLVRFAPLGCPVIIEVLDYQISLRKCHAKLITIKPD